MMSDLKESFSKKIYNKEDGWFKNMTSFWARDILEPKKAIVQKFNYFDK